MSDLGPSKGAHHITENLIKHMSDEQGPSNTRPKNRCRGPISFDYSTALISPEKESFFVAKNILEICFFIFIVIASY